MRYKLLELDSVSILLFVIVVTCFGVSVGKAGATPASLTNLNSLLSGNLDPYSDNYIRIQYPTGWEVLRPGVNFRVDTTDVIFMPKSEYQNYLFSPLSYMPSTFIQVSTYPARNLTLPEFTSIVVNNISSNFAEKFCLRVRKMKHCLEYQQRRSK